MLIGPTRAHPEVLSAVREPAPPIDSSEFLRALESCLVGMRRLHGSKRGASFVVPGTGTAGLEAVAASFVPAGEKVCVLVTGVWGRRWAHICRTLGLQTLEVTTPADAPCDLNALAAQ